MNLLLASCTVQASQITLFLQKGFVQGKVPHSKTQPNTPAASDAKDGSSEGDTMLISVSSPTEVKKKQLARLVSEMT